MKTIRTFCLMMVAACAAVSCDKDKPDEKNPPVVEVPAAPFTLTAVESRNGHDYPWTISRAGVTNSVEEELDEMWLTMYNSIVVTVTPDGAGEFPGFNVRSSNTSVVEVVNVNSNSFELKRSFVQRGTEATIEVWNGSGSTMQKTSFQVKAKQMIEPTAFVFEVDGKRIEVPLYYSWQEGDQHAVTILTIPESEKDANTNVIHKIVCAGVVPENASCDYAEIGQLLVEKEWVDWLKGQGKDFTFYTVVSSTFEGSLDELWEHNTMYTCLRPWGLVSDQYEAPIRIVLSKNKSVGVKYGSAYIYCPFPTMDEELEWIHQHWH